MFFCYIPFSFGMDIVVCLYIYFGMDLANTHHALFIDS